VSAEVYPEVRRTGRWAWVWEWRVADDYGLSFGHGRALTRRSATSRAVRYARRLNARRQADRTPWERPEGAA
jgi:hypothetical protein